MTSEQINEKIDEVGISRINYNSALSLAEALERGLPLHIEFNDGVTFIILKYEYNISGITQGDNGVFSINVKIKAV